MQLMIDISQETPAALRLATKFLTDHAAMREAMEAGLPLPTMPAVPGPLNVPAGTPPVVVPVPPPPAPEAPQGSTVVPFPSPVPPAPSATVPAISTTTPTSGTAPAASAVAASTPPAPSPSSVVTPPQADVYDSSGMPWDARIHQKGHGVKKDKTWKLQKGIDPAVVAAVTQELAAQGRVRQPAAPTAPSAPPAFGQQQLPPAAGVPAATFPPQTPPAPEAQAQGYTAGSLPLPPPVPQTGTEAQGGQAQGGQVAPLPPPVSVHAAVPVPAAPVVGVPNAPNAGVVQVGFREVVAKISAARNAGKLSAEQVTAIVQQAGAPSLQMLANMAHLVPTVDALVDAALATA